MTTLPSTRRPSRVRRQPKSLQAAAQQMPVGAAAVEGPDRQRGGFGWQDRCWQVYRDLGMVHYGMSFVRHNVAKLDIFVGRASNDPEADSEPLDWDHPAAVELARIGEGPYGDVSDVVAEAVVHNQVAGEARVTAWQGDDDETWEILTSQELKRRTMTGNTPAIDFRIWRPDPTRPTWPDSPLRSVLAECEDLIFSRRQVRGALLSRLNNGALFIPEELSPHDPNATDDGMSPLMRDMFAAFSAPIANPESAAGFMPYIFEGKGDYIDRIRYEPLDRPVDTFMIELRGDLERAIAAGLDLPAERLIGMGGLNHWSAWLIDDSTYAQHLAPAVDLVVRGIRKGFLEDAWRDKGLDPDEFTVMVDPTPLTSRVRKGQDAIEAFDRYAVGVETLRRELGFDESDAPSQDELEWRLALVEPQDSAVAIIRGADGSNVSPGIPEPPEAMVASGLVLVAATGEQVISGRPLADVDRRLVSDLSESTERTANRIVADVARRLHDEIDGVDTGDGSVEALALAVTTAGVTADEAVPGDAVEDEDRAEWLTLMLAGLVAAYAQVRRIARATGAEDAMAVLDRGELDRLARVASEGVPVPGDSLEARLVRQASAGVDQLAAGVVGGIRDRLFSTKPAPDAAVGQLLQGEVPAGLVPGQAIIDAMTTAGGGPGATPGSIGVANGATAEEWLEQMGVVTRAWSWRYGEIPRATFPPHRRLDGVTFTGWADEILYNAGAFPTTEFYRPGDHKGCLCTAERTFVVGGDILPV